MGKRGFTQQPAAIAKINGTFRADRYGSDEDRPTPQYLNYVPSPPDGLNDEGQNFWNGLLGELVKIDGLIAFSHLGVFEQMCFNYQTIKQCQPELAKGLTTIDGKTGNNVVNPYWKIYNDAFKNFIAIAREFGCTPSAMDRIKITPKKEDNEPDFEI